MKKNVPKGNSLRRRGFYVALYSGLCIAMVMVAVASLNNLNNAPQLPPVSEQNMDFGALEATGTGDGGIAEAAIRPPVTAPPPGTTAPGQQPPANGAPMAPGAAAPAGQPAAPTPPAGAPGQPAAPPTTEDDSAAVPPEGTPEAPGEQEPAEQPGGQANMTALAPSFHAFDEDQRMVWPVVGEILMRFSNTTAIFDQTLDQYRTNEVVAIAADLGAQVVAAADGIVLSVERTRDHGNTVVIDNGNGWRTTYSQLQDGVLVQEGDIVSQGQVIGGVASPSIHSVLLGNHVGFRVTRDDIAVDPFSVME